MMVAKQKNSSIQALRAVAAMIVFLSHSLMMIKSDTILMLHDTPLHFLFDGQCAVIFFMVLSGFFYYKVEAFTFKRYPHGLWKKIVRIYPVHIIMICLGVLLCNLQLSYDSGLFSEWGNTFWTRSVSLAETVRQMIIILPGTDPNLVNPPIWYLSAEVRMFIVMPLLVGLLNKLGEAEDSIFFWGAWISMCIISGFIYPFALCYLIGYMTARVLNKHWNGHDGELSPILIGGGIIASVMLINIRNEISIIFEWVSLVIQSLGAAILIALFFLKDCINSNSILVKAGEYSYEYYLSHFVVLLLCKSFVSNVIWYWIIALLMTIGLTVILHRIQLLLSKRLI